MSTALAAWMLFAVTHQPAADAAAIEGSWRPTMIRLGLQNVGDHVLAEERWTIQGGRFSTETYQNRNRRIVATTRTVELRLNPNVTPKQVDAVVIEGPDVGRTEPGIYELD